MVIAFSGIVARDRARRIVLRRGAARRTAPRCRPGSGSAATVQTTSTRVLWLVFDGTGLARALKRTMHQTSSARTKSDDQRDDDQQAVVEAVDHLHDRRGRRLERDLPRLRLRRRCRPGCADAGRQASAPPSTTKAPGHENSCFKLPSLPRRHGPSRASDPSTDPPGPAATARFRMSRRVACDTNHKRILVATDDVCARCGKSRSPPP